MTHEAAWRQAREQLKDISRTDILVGLPTFNDANTIEHVVKTAVEGLSRSFPQASVVIVNVDAGSQDGTPEVITNMVGEAMPAVSVQHLTSAISTNPFTLHRLSEAGVPGREQAFQALFTIAAALETKACVILDANIRSIRADWMELLLHPVLEKKADFVAPLYSRPRYEGSLTNSLIYPLSRALYGKQLRWQTGGGYGFSGEVVSVYLNKDVWGGEVGRLAIDSWLPTVAVAEGCDVWQAYLGAKVQESKQSGIELASVLAQTVGAVFYFMETYQHVWDHVTASTPVPTAGPVYELSGETMSMNIGRMIQGFRQGVRDLLPIWEIILSPETLTGVLALGLVEEEEFRFPVSLWVQTVYDFAVAYRAKVLHREHLLKSLAPLYLGLTASFVLETGGGRPEDVEAAVETLCGTFERMKPYLIERWRFQ